MNTKNARASLIVLSLLLAPRSFAGIDCRRDVPTRSPAIDLALGLQSRLRATSPSDRKSAELQIANALHQSGIIRPAHAAYRAILRSNEAAPTDRLSAMTCLNRIERVEPALAMELPLTFLTSVASLSSTDGEHQSEGAEFVFRRFLIALRDDTRRATAIQALLAERFAARAETQAGRAFLLANEKKPIEAAKLLEELLSKPRLPEGAERHRNALMLLAGRTAFAGGRPLDAARWYRSIEKSSNSAPLALEELTWALLEGERPGEAVGTALQLEKGLMARTFAPEAQMVMAMSLNELCQYPAALGSLSRFRRRWQPIHQWLENYSRHPAALLPQTRALLRKNPGSTIPAMIGWELIRSPQYLSQESLLVVLSNEQRRFEDLRQKIRSDRLRIAQEILTLSGELTHRIRREGRTLTSQTESELIRLRNIWYQYRALRRAAAPVRRMAVNASRQAPALRTTGERWLENDLQRRARRMKIRLDEVLENLGLIEIEILDGASRDLVWQNAHPDLVAEARKRATDGPGRNKWNWGTTFTAIQNTGDSREELWEDELGSHEVLLSDRCEQRERHLAMQKGHS